MKTSIRKISDKFISISLTEGNTTIDFGFLDDAERDYLAAEFLSAVYQMGPPGKSDCDAWLFDLSKALGIEVENDKI